jgi:hypothetical protein
MRCCNCGNGWTVCRAKPGAGGTGAGHRAKLYGLSTTSVYLVIVD